MKLSMLAGVLGAVLVLSYGCGSPQHSCGEGTVLEGGACVVNTSGCGAGTALQVSGLGSEQAERVCVPVEAACGDSASFDRARRRCVPDSEVVCGPGTVAGEDGVCAAGADACDGPAWRDDSGRCVVGAVSCGPGTALDATSGECVLSAEACADGLVLDADTETCVPTDKVCDAGTRFDADSGLCLPDSCDVGDVLVDQVCVSQAEALAGDADLVEVENNDPAFGGEAQTLVLKPMGDEPLVFTGAVGAPSDLDGDGELDQDVDVFEFEAQAGEWFEIALYPLDGGEPAFRVEGPEGFVRESPLGTSSSATSSETSRVARAVVVPADGTYTVSVLPALAMYGGAQPVGDDWGYVGQMEVIDWPTPVEVDMSSGEARISGEVSQLSNNLFELTGMTFESLVDANVEVLGADAEAMFQVWRAPETLRASEALRLDASYDFGADGSSALVLVDWVRATGPNLDFELRAKVGGTRRVATILPGETETVSVQAIPYDNLTATQTNRAGAELEAVLTKYTGALVDSQTLASGDELGAVASTAGEYTVEFTNPTQSPVDATLTLRAQAPQEVGPLAVGDADVYVHPTTVFEGDSVFHKVTLTEPGRLHVRVAAPEPDPEVFVLSSGLTVLHSAETYGDVEDFIVDGTLAPGDYLIEVLAYWELASYDLSVNLLPVP